MEQSLAQYYQRWIEVRDERSRLRQAAASYEPFAWGADGVLGWPSAGADRFQNEETQLRTLARKAAEASDQFFAHQTPTDFHMEGSELTFTSAVQTRHWENNTAFARWYPAREKSE